MERRLDNVDALRGVAILAVLQLHLFSTSGGYAWLDMPAVLQLVLAYGWAGVDLFFVLSAWLLTTNLLRHSGCDALPLTFYKRRALRILPLYVLLLGTGFSLEALWRQQGGGDVWLWSGHYPLWTYLLFLQNWICGLDGAPVAHFYAPTWSLAVEEHFYLVLPLFVARMSPRSVAAVAISWILSAPLIRWGVEAAVNPLAPYVWSIARLDSFGWGMLLAAAPRVWPQAVARLNARKLLAGALPLAVIAPLAFPDQHGVHDNVFGITAMTWLAAAATFAATSMHPATLGRTGLVKRGLIWCGQRCYSLYLLHMPVLGLVFLLMGSATPGARGAGAFAATCLAGVLTFLIADVAYRRIELPFMRLAGRYASYRRDESPARLSEAVA